MRRWLELGCSVALAGCNWVLGIEEVQRAEGAGASGAGSSGTGAAGAEGGAGGAGAGGGSASSSGGGGGVACGNGEADVGELCFYSGEGIPDPPFSQTTPPAPLDPRRATDFAVIDCNGDGEHDHVVVSHVSDLGVTALPLGGGTASQLVAGDFDELADAELDTFTGTSLVLGLGNNEAQILTQTIQPSGCEFTARTPFSLGQHVQDIAVGNLDTSAAGDEVVLATSGSYCTLEADGAGGDACPLRGDADTPKAAATGAVRDAQTVDFLYTSSSPNDLILVSPSAQYTADTVNVGVALAVGDLDESSAEAEIVVGAANGRITVFRFQGTPPGLTPINPEAPLVDGTPSAIALGDLNGDSHLDAVTASDQNRSVTILLGDGTGALVPATPEAGLGFVALAEPHIAVSHQPIGLRILDLNDDGALDLLVLMTEGGVGYVARLLADP